MSSFRNKPPTGREEGGRWEGEEEEEEEEGWRGRLGGLGEVLRGGGKKEEN